MSAVPPPLVLASASPRRAELLARVDLHPTVDPAAVDEAVLPDERPADYVLRVALDKAHAVAARHPGAVVLAADTAVVADGEPLGQPADEAAALAMLGALAGRSHQVLTAVVATRDGIDHSLLARAEVTMAPSSEQERRWYVANGEPFGKAGAYAVQGAGAVLVERVEGDPTTVIGLPLRATVELLVALGVSWP